MRAQRTTNGGRSQPVRWSRTGASNGTRSGDSVQRILLVLQSTAVGGMETYCAGLAEEFRGRGLDVAVLVPESAMFEPIAQRVAAAGARVERLDTDARHGRIAQVARWLRLVRFLRAWAPDVVHLHTGGATGGFAVIAAARLLTPATVLYTEHDLPALRPGRKLLLVKRVMDRLAYAVIACSRKMAALRDQRLGRTLPDHRFAAVLIGIPDRDWHGETTAVARAVSRAELGIPASAFVIGSVVRLAPGKGLDDLLRAFALARTAVDAKLLLVGDGPLRQDLESLAEALGIGDDVIFAGYQESPRQFFGAMDLFALAVHEGTGSLALMEAMAHGLPAVITFAGPEEAVVPGVTGLGAPPAAPELLADVLARLIHDPDLRMRFAARGRAYVRDRFSMGRVASDLLVL